MVRRRNRILLCCCAVRGPGLGWKLDSHRARLILDRDQYSRSVSEVEAHLDAGTSRAETGYLVLGVVSVRQVQVGTCALTLGCVCDLLGWRLNIRMVQAPCASKTTRLPQSSTGLFACKSLSTTLPTQASRRNRHYERVDRDVARRPCHRSTGGGCSASLRKVSILPAHVVNL